MVPTYRRRRSSARASYLDSPSTTARRLVRGCVHLRNEFVHLRNEIRQPAQRMGSTKPRTEPLLPVAGDAEAAAFAALGRCGGTAFLASLLAGLQGAFWGNSARYRAR